MERLPLRYVAIPIGVLVAFASVLFLHYGTAIGWNFGVIGTVLLATVAFGTVTAIFTTGRRRLAVVLVTVGIVAFVLGTDGGRCVDLLYPDDAVYRITYRPATNVLEFGPSIGDSYQCRTTPDWSLLVAGYAATSLGVGGAVSSEA